MTPPALIQAETLLARGRAAEARDVLRRYLAARPADAQAAAMLATAHLAMHEHAPALTAAERALRAVPGDPSLLCVKGDALAGLGRDPESDATFAAAGDDARVLGAWATALMRGGRQENAGALLHRALGRHPDDAALLQRACYAENVLGFLSQADERVLHERLARTGVGGTGQPPHGLPRGTAEFPNSRAPERALRVAFMSADLCLHSCAFFLEPLIEQLDRARVVPLLYSTTPSPDGVTARFKTLGEWRECGRLTPEELGALARRDAVDILIDANGWTVAGQMAGLARRVAPVQAAYLGYPNTTGMMSMDWRVVDAATDPPGAEAACTERLWRMPGCFLCFRADPAWPAPVLWRDRRPTFGSFNNAAKITAGVVEAWSAVLKAVPDSRLLVKAGGLEGPRAERLRGAFEAAGIAPDRLDLRSFVPDTAAHINLYNEVDVALDTFPYNGTTTTCEALWMGVPVVALAGDRHRARVGVSLLRAIGAPELIAADTDGYVALAARLAGDHDRLRAYRLSLRERMGASPLCDAAGHARRFEDPLRGMWRSWCAG